MTRKTTAFFVLVCVLLISGVGKKEIDIASGVKAIFEVSPYYRTAKMRTRETEVRAESERRYYFPVLRGDVRKSENRSSYGTTTTETGALSVGFVLFSPERWYGARAAKYEVEASRQQLYGELLSQVESFEFAYLDYVLHSAERRVYDDTVRWKSEELRRAEERRKVGLATDYDVSVVRLSMLEAQYKARSAEVSVSSTLSKVNTLLGGDYSLKVPEDWGFSILEGASLPKEDDVLKSPQFLTQLYALKKAEVEAAGAERYWLPTVSLSGSYDVSSLFDSPEESRGYVFSLSFTFWGYSNLKSVEASRLEVRRMRLEVEKTEKELRERYRDLKRELELEEENLKLVEERVNLSKSHLAKTREMYEAGLVDVLALMDAENSLRDAQLDLLRSRVTVLKTRLSIYHLCGFDPVLSAYLDGTN